VIEGKGIDSINKGVSRKSLGGGGMEKGNGAAIMIVGINTNLVIIVVVFIIYIVIVVIAVAIIVIAIIVIAIIVIAIIVIAVAVIAVAIIVTAIGGCGLSY